MTHKQYAQGHAARILEGPLLQNKTTLTSGTKLEGKHTTVVIGRHVAIRIYEPAVVTHLPSPCTNKRSVFHQLIIDTSCGFIRICICTVPARLYGKVSAR